MDTGIWLAFLVTAIAAALVPGPAVLLVVGHSIRNGTRAGMVATLGVLGGNTIWFTASALGLATLVALAEPVFVAIKWAGVVYLTWIGISAWRDAVRGDTRLAPRPRTPASGARIGRQAVLLQLANPKAVVFFTALLPQFVDAAHPIAAQVAQLAVASIVSEFFVLSGYAWIAARGGAFAMHSRPRLARAGDAASGTCLIGAGLGLALAHPLR